MATYNVLFLPKWYPNKKDPQAGIFVRKHAQAAALHHNVAVLYISSDEEISKQEIITDSSNGVLEIAIYFKRSTLPILKKVINFYRYFKASKKGYEILLKQWEKPDLVHVNVLTRPGIFAFYLKNFKNIPYIITDHWSGYIEDDFSKKNAVEKWLVRRIAGEAKIILPVSEALMKGMQANKLKNKYKVVPNVVEPVLPKSSGHIKKGKVIIVNVSDLDDKIKNISGLLNAFNEVVKQRPQAELHIIGGSYDEQKLHQQAKELGLWETSVFFHGTMKNEAVLQFLTNSDFLVVNSNIETFSVVTAEAMACGKPVVSTKCGGPEQFINEENGILIDKNEQQQLQKALLKMIDTYHEYNAEHIKKGIGSKLSMAAVGKILDEVYREILEK